MKRIKIRFSYFLILGIIGIIFQIVSFLAWENIEVSQSQLITSSTTEYFDAYIKQNYFVIVSAIFMICFAVGLVLCSKKEQLLTKIGGYTIGISELITIIVTIIYISYVTKNRVTMFKEEEQIAAINNLVNIKYTSIILTHIGFGISFFGLLKYQRKEKIARVGSLIGLVTNGLLVVGLIVVLVGGISTQSYEVTNRFIELSKNLADPYELLYGSMNGFTYSHLERLFTLNSEIVTSVNPSSYAALHTSVIIALITLVINVAVIISNLVSLSLLTVQSFDVSKDDTPMEF